MEKPICPEYVSEVLRIKIDYFYGYLSTEMQKKREWPCDVWTRWKIVRD